MAQEPKFDVIQEYGGTAYSPDFGAWADLNYEENGKEFARTTMVLVNPAWTEPLEKAGGEYFPPNWAYDPEADMYLLLVKWQNGVRLPIAFRKEEAGKLLFDNYVKIPFDIMIANKKISGNIEEDESLRMHVLWDVKFSKSPQAAWPE